MKSIYKITAIFTIALCLLFFVVINFSTNNPYRTGELESKTLFVPYFTQIKLLDPARSYYSHEGKVIDNIYEPPLTYHYLKRPYKMIPLTVKEVPKAIYFDKNGKVIDSQEPDADQVGRVEYIFHLKKRIKYQIHPCFAKNSDGSFKYQNLNLADAKDIKTPYDFELSKDDSQELVAKDYVRQIRRLADPRLSCPLLSTLTPTIAGLKELNESYKNMLADDKENFDYFTPKFIGAQVIDKYTFKLTLKRKYPIILYQMAMHFFAPMPQEALDFYDQPAMKNNEITLNHFPIGTGPYYLKEFTANRRIVLEKNILYHEERYPSEGAAGDKERGLLADAGKILPMIERVVFTMEKEAIPRWNKFLQGYYDQIEVTNDAFEQAVNLSSSGEMDLSPEMQKHGIKMDVTSDLTTYYFGFNMLDKTIGGYTPEKQKLRQAISIILDSNQYLDLFLNGRGKMPNSIIPPGIRGYVGGKKGCNNWVDEWNDDEQKLQRRSVEVAKKLLKEAGYDNGCGADGKPLILNYDHGNGGKPDSREKFIWLKKRFALLGIVLKERKSDANTFRTKVDKGNFQIILTGWGADYPDPENFLFLFYGPNSKVKTGGVNSVNYNNPEFDSIFKKLETMSNGPKRDALIAKALEILAKDAPGALAFHPDKYQMNHQWLHNEKIHHITSSFLKYKRIDSTMRSKEVANWNKPRTLPVIIIFLGILFIFIPGALYTAYRKEKGL